MKVRDFGCFEALALLFAFCMAAVGPFDAMQGLAAFEGLHPTGRETAAATSYFALGLIVDLILLGVNVAQVEDGEAGCLPWLIVWPLALLVEFVVIQLAFLGVIH